MLVCGVIPVLAAAITAVAVARRTLRQRRAQPLPSSWEAMEAALELVPQENILLEQP